jgi:cytochrome c-type biogenesis protein CcmH/NrfG
MLGKVFKDENNAAEAAKALYMATRLAEEDMKSQGKTAPKWLQEAYFDLGQIELNLNDYAKARDAWDKYVMTSPPPGMKLDKVNEKLRTTLKKP